MMGAAIDQNLPRVILLRQVEGPRWCVVMHRVRGRKLEFLARIATARPYQAACRIAVSTAQSSHLRLATQAAGERPRRFDSLRDLPRGAAA